MSEQDPNLFSEVQLAQIATMMPHLVTKQKARAAEVASPAPPLVQTISESANLNSSETQKGILRLAEFLKKQKKEPEPHKETQKETQKPQIDQLKVIPFRRVSGPSLSQFLVKRGLQTYQWVTTACQNAEESAVQINKYF